MRLFVKFLTGKTVILEDVEASDNIDAVKQKIQEREGIPPHQQRFVFAGRQIDNDKSLSEHRVSNECTLHMILRLGGPPPGPFPEQWVKALSRETLLWRQDGECDRKDAVTVTFCTPEEAIRDKSETPREVYGINVDEFTNKHIYFVDGPPCEVTPRHPNQVILTPIEPLQHGRTYTIEILAYSFDGTSWNNFFRVKPACIMTSAGQVRSTNYNPSGGHIGSGFRNPGRFEFRLD